MFAMDKGRAVVRVIHVKVDTVKELVRSYDKVEEEIV
jgi:hypothetical protein